MTEHVLIEATIVDKWGRVETVYVGSQPLWAWNIDRCEAWRKMMRKQILSDRTYSPEGWRVTFSVMESEDISNV